MNKCAWYSFDDVLIVPKFSDIFSREQISTKATLGNNKMVAFQVPVISANMDTITGPEMVNAMWESGGYGALHRFCSIEENVAMFRKNRNCFVSFGTKDGELDRAMALFDAGADKFILDIAHGASVNAVVAYNAFRKATNNNRNIHVMVGNFATAESIKKFVSFTDMKPDAFKVGIGGGSMCTTRIVTGVGIPTLGSVLDCSILGYDIVADGGIRNSGDVAKCLAAGAKAVMIGGMLSGTEETPGAVELYNDAPHKIYRGSASKESYQDQGKVSSHRTPEGVSTYVRCKGSAKDVVQSIQAGIASCLSYINAKNLAEIKEKAEFIEITSNGMKESHAHGKQ
jgi:IMP dehydrogenase